MMDLLKKNMVPIGVVLVMIFGGFVYFMYFSDSSSATLTASDSGVPLTTDILTTLQSIHSIKLDETVFTDPVFTSLSDYGVTIPPGKVGRRNPFLPLTFSSPPGVGSSSIPLPH